MSGEMKENTYSFVIFGRDIFKIPCLRKSLFIGIQSGLGAGLLTFLFTSRAMVASHTAMGTYCCVSLGYFFYCRHNYLLMQKQIEEVKQGFHAARVKDEEETGSENEKGLVTV